MEPPNKKPNFIFSNWEEEKKLLGNIQPKYKEALQQLLNQMEKETGNMYQITVNKFGNYHDCACIIGEFKKRELMLRVFDMDPEYKALEGIYLSKADIDKKLQELREQEMYEETKHYTDNIGIIETIGKCKRCHSYNENVPGRCPNFTNLNICQNKDCCWSLYSHWDNIHADDFRGTIYQDNGGSLSVCFTRGKYEFISI